MFSKVKRFKISTSQLVMKLLDMYIYSFNIYLLNNNHNNMLVCCSICSEKIVYYIIAAVVINICLMEEFIVND